MMKLDIGCGSSKKEGYLGVDIINLDGVDIVHDLNKFPYPWEANSVSEIWMDNVLEHLQKPNDVMNEIYRICVHQAKIIVSVPYFRSFYSSIDPTHINSFGTQYFNYFDPTHPFYEKYHYFNSRFLVKKIEFDREWQGKMGLLHKLLVRFAEKYPLKYEARLSHLLPLNSLTFYLETVKQVP
jgi:predicted SAM-dependent methyltransferase